MTIINDLLHTSILFWMTWVIIPIVMELLPTIFDFGILLKRYIFRGKERTLDYQPEITLIIPVYNSRDTLYECIRSVNDSDYDSKKIFILLVNNQSKDDSFSVYTRCQKDFPDLTINWINARQGKSKALNMALFNSYGKYIIHIDSDGILHPNAIKNIVKRFENDDSVDCLTGTVLTNPELIEATDKPSLKLLQRLEFMEYCNAFLAGRNFQSEFNAIFTLSGACSAFRKSAILKTQLYNTDTICEDTHVTFQIRDMLGDRVALCEDAIFMVDPIESLNRLYIQRQRWQRGEIEVMHMFKEKNLHIARGFMSDFIIRLLIYDHTFAFPRMIWYFALICLSFLSYPVKLIVESVIMLYLLYTFSTALLYVCIILFLKDEKKLRRYYAKKWYLVVLMPAFNFVSFWFRFVGIINSINGKQSWKMRDFTEEKAVFTQKVRSDHNKIDSFILKLRNAVNEVEENG